MLTSYQITSKTNIKVLRIQFDSDLRWTLYMCYVRDKINS